MSRFIDIALMYVFVLLAVWHKAAGNQLTAIYALLFVLAWVAIRAYAKWTEPRP